MARHPTNADAPQGDPASEDAVDSVDLPRAQSHGRAALFFLFKAAVTVALLAWLFSRSEQLNAVNNPFLNPGDLSHSWLLIGVLFCGIYLVSWAFRWLIFLNLLGLPIGFRRTFQLTIAGHFLSMASFGGLAADALKAIYLIRRFPQKKGAVAIAICADHLSGLASVGIAFSLLTWTRVDEITGGDSPIGEGALWAASGLWGAMMIGLILTVGLAHPKLMKHANSKLGFLRKNEALRNFVGAWDVFRREWRPALAACAISFPMLLSYYLVFYAGARAAHVQTTALDLLGAMPVVDTLTALPVTVAGLGLRETLMESLLGTLANVSLEDSVRLSLTGFGILLIWGVIGAMTLPFLRIKKSSTQSKGS